MQRAPATIHAAAPLTLSIAFLIIASEKPVHPFQDGLVAEDRQRENDGHPEEYLLPVEEVPVPEKYGDSRAEDRRKKDIPAFETALRVPFLDDLRQAHDHDDRDDDERREKVNAHGFTSFLKIPAQRPRR